MDERTFEAWWKLNGATWANQDLEARVKAIAKAAFFEGIDFQRGVMAEALS
jgi:hypothetical protein